MMKEEIMKKEMEGVGVEGERAGVWDDKEKLKDGRRETEPTAPTDDRKLNLREEVNSITARLDALLTVLHEVPQGEQGVVTHKDPVFRGPRFHGHQDDASVELLLVDLAPSEGKSRIRQIRNSCQHERQVR